MWLYSLSPLLKSIPVLERRSQICIKAQCHTEEGGTDSLILSVLNHISLLAQTCSTSVRWKSKVQDKHCISSTELPHQPWKASGAPGSGAEPRQARAALHHTGAGSLFTAFSWHSSRKTLNTANGFSWHGGKHKSINHHLPTAQSTGNEWCLGATGCHVFLIILLPSLTAVLQENSNPWSDCAVTSLITNTGTSRTNCFPTPFLPQTTQDVTTTVCYETWEVQWPKTQSFKQKWCINNIHTPSLFSRCL